MLAMMITNGKLLQGDVNFKKGNNGVSVYNNAGNGNVTVTRVAKSSDNPTTSTHEIEIKPLVLPAQHGVDLFNSFMAVQMLFLLSSI